MSLTDAPTITIDGVVLNDTFNISEIKRPFPSVAVYSTEVDGRDGSVLRGHALETRQVSFTLWAFNADHQSLAESFQALLELLNEADEHTLTFSDEGGLVRIGTLTGDLNFDEYTERASVALTFTQFDPYREYPEETAVTIPSGGSATFTIAHPRPHIMVLSTAAQRDATTQMWSLTFDESDYMRVRLPSALTTQVSIDALTRRVLVGNATSMLTLESDWPILAAGTHTVRMDQGMGGATLIIRERCL